MGIVTLSGTLDCASEAEAQLILRLVDDHVSLSQNEPGCLRFAITQSDDNPLVFDVDEAFASPRAFELHTERTRSSAWWASTQHITRNISRFEE